MKLFLVRHGETDWNKEGRLQGRNDIPLNETGIVQMERVADKLCQLSNEIDLIISTPLVRANKSAAIIAEKIGYEKDIVIEPLFIERSFGSSEGMKKSTKIKENAVLYGWEDFDKFLDRARAGLQKYVDSGDKNILIVAHGDILQAIIVVMGNGKIGYYDGTLEARQGGIAVLELDNIDSKILNVYEINDLND